MAAALSQVQNMGQVDRRTIGKRRETILKVRRVTIDARRRRCITRPTNRKRPNWQRKRIRN
jgi:hypothetical protein